MNDLNQKVSAGDVEKCDVLQKREEILHEWRLGRNGKGPIVGAVDLSTHEFEMSAVWMREMQDQRRKVSDACAHDVYNRRFQAQRYSERGMEGL